MAKYYEIKGRVAISGNPMTDAKLLGRFQAEYDALSEKFVAAGGALDMRIVTEKEKAASQAPASVTPIVVVEGPPEPPHSRRHAAE